MARTRFAPSFKDYLQVDGAETAAALKREEALQHLETWAF